MGEEGKKEEGNKEEEKKEEGNKEEKKVEGDEKKEEEPQEIVLKVDMHCEACARKVARVLKGFQGVEDVTADYKASKVIVKGKTADPIKVRERIQKKSGRKVELISPLPKPPPDDNKEENKEPPPPPPEENKEQPPAVITVVLNIQMHCEACAQVLQKRIRKVKGVESVTTDVANNQVVVKGIVDPEMLVSDVYKRTRKLASIVKESEEEKKKEEDQKKEEEKKEKEGEANEKVEAKKEGEEGKEGGEDNKTGEMKKSEYWAPKHYYYTDYSYPPQFFSDENPNACSLM